MDRKFETTTLLVYVRNSPLPTVTVAEQDELQAAHLAFLDGLVADGTAHVAGPFSDQSDEQYRGLMFLRIPPAEAAALVAHDPLVRAGFLRAEVMTWWHHEGAVTFSRPTTSPDA